MKKFIVLLVLPLLALSGCNREGTGGDGRPRAALVLKTLNNPFFISLQQGAEEAAERLGINLVVQAAEREVDVEKQMQIIENLIQTRIDVLLVSPSGSREILPSILKANEAGIPVLIVDTRVDEVAAKEVGAEVETFIGSDNYQGGYEAGRYVASQGGPNAKIAILEGIPGHETADSRFSGFMAAIEKGGGAKVVATQPANWERDQGFNVAQNLFQAHPEINVLFACNDMMALGAVEAIAAAGKTGDVLVVGFDAVKDARQAIAEGSLAASIAQYPSEIGRIALESAAKVLKGETLPKNIPVPIELVTKENLNTIDW